MKRNIVILGILWMICGIFLCTPRYVNALESSGEGIDYTEIEQVMDELLPEGEKAGFADFVDWLVKGDFHSILTQVKKFVLEQLTFEIDRNRHVLIQMIGIILISAVFTNFSMAFSKTHIAETGFYLTYMVLFVLLLTTFMETAKIAETMLANMLKFMTALVPVFCMAVTFTGKLQSGMVYQQAMVTGITLIEWIVSKGLFVLIYMFVLISLVNQLSKEDILSKCSDLIRTVAAWILKTVPGILIGLNFIQSLVLPAFDSVKNGWAMRVSTAIPGVGDAMNSAVKTVIGTAILLKNGIGAAGLILLSVIFLIPALKLAVIALMYMAAQAVVQPVADQRMLRCLQAVSEGVMLLFKVQGMVFILFFVSLAIMTAASGMVFG